MKRWFIKNKTPLLSPLEGYNHWASTYATESNPIKNLSNKLVEQWLHDVTGKSILDVGCGTGHFCRYVEKNNAARIIGVDLSPAMLSQAKKNCISGEFYCADITTMPFEHSSFDLIICALVIGHIENMASALDMLCSILKRNGELIITDFHPDQTKRQAKRTFTDPQTGTTAEIKHHHHSLGRIIDHLKNSGLTIEHVEEPQWNNAPVVYGIHCKKTS
jgi:malonyl-CoA O-methyltransferase